MNWVGRLVQAEIGKNDSVIELGCGVMQATMDTCKHYPQTKLKCGLYVGVDGFQEYVDFLNKRGDVKAIHWNLNTSPYPFQDKSFDHVLLIDVIEHLPSLEAAETLILESKRIARKAIYLYTPKTFHDNKETVDCPPYPYSDFGGNKLQQHHILISESWLVKRGFKVKTFNVDHGSFYAVCTLERCLLNQVKRQYRFILKDVSIQLFRLRNFVFKQYFRVFHNHETDKGHWEVTARINPYAAVCASAKTHDDFFRIKDSVLFHSGVDYKGKNVLDVCCGLGRIAKVIACDVKSYVGVDWSSNMVKKAKQLHEGTRNVGFLVNNGRDLSCLPTGMFDVAVCELAFQHMKKKTTEAYIKEVHRVLKSNGVFAAQLPRKDFYEQFAESKGRGYLLEEAKQAFKDFGRIVHVEGYNHGHAYYLIVAYKEATA